MKDWLVCTKQLVKTAIPAIYASVIIAVIVVTSYASYCEFMNKMFRIPTQQYSISFRNNAILFVSDADGVD